MDLYQEIEALFTPHVYPTIGDNMWAPNGSAYHTYATGVIVTEDVEPSFVRNELHGMLLALFYNLRYCRATEKLEGYPVQYAFREWDKPLWLYWRRLPAVETEVIFDMPHDQKYQISCRALVSNVPPK